MTSIPPHNNVVRIYGLCQEQNNFSLVMEFAENGALDAFAGQKVASGEWDPTQLWTIVHGIACGMAHLAGNKLVHRDVRGKKSSPTRPRFLVV